MYYKKIYSYDYNTVPYSLVFWSEFPYDQKYLLTAFWSYSCGCAEKEPALNVIVYSAENNGGVDKKNIRICYLYE